MYGFQNCSRPEPKTGFRAVLSLREAVVIAEVPEQTVRKDIETGLLTAPMVIRLTDDRDNRLAMHWNYVFTLAAVYGNKYLGASLRRYVLQRVDRTVVCQSSTWSCVNDHRRLHFYDCGNHIEPVELDKYVTLDLRKVVESIRPRVALYSYGLERIEEKEGILGGDAVFAGTRIPVSHIGRMYARGVPLHEILSDFVGLSEDDVKFAKLYHDAHPAVGRPRASAETPNNESVPPAA